MRQQPDIATLQTLIAAVPPEALRELVLELMLNSATPPTAPAARRAPAALPAAAPAPVSPAKRPVGWPRGRPRGKRKPAETAETNPVGDPEKLAAKQQRRNAARRQQRAAAKVGPPPVEAAKAGDTHKSNGKGGNGSSPDAKAQAAALWRHAELLSPSAAWRALERSTGLNAAVVLDAFRTRSLPPGIDAAAIERFLAQPAN